MPRRLVWRGIALRRAADAHRTRTMVAAGVVQTALALLLALSPGSPIHAAGAPAPVVLQRPAVASALPPVSSPAVISANDAASVSAPPAPVQDAPTEQPVPVLAPADAGDLANVPRGQDRVPRQSAPPSRTATPSPTASPSATASPTATPTATATATAVPTETPNPYAGDTITDLSRVPDAQAIFWAAYIPAPVGAPVPGVKGTGQFIMPVYGFISTQYTPVHLGIDIAGPTGSPVVAADSGTVVFAGTDFGGLGYAVEIDHGNGFVSAYGHNSEVDVRVGQIVRRGDLIAYRGSTGHSTGPHVHFAIHLNGQAVDPFNYLIAGDPPAPIPQVQVPKLVGLSPAEAQAALRGLRLTLAFDPAQVSPDVPAGKLAAQQQAAGSLADVDSVLHVAISSGPPTPTATATPTASAATTSATQTSSTKATTSATTAASGAAETRAGSAPTATATATVRPPAPTATATPPPTVGRGATGSTTGSAVKPSR